MASHIVPVNIDASTFVQTSLDPEIEALALQLEEIDIFEQSRKGKHASHEVPDWLLALQAMQDDIETHLTLLQDLKMAHSIAAAVQQDDHIIMELVERDRQVDEDRQTAFRHSIEDDDLQAPPPYTKDVEIFQHHLDDAASRLIDKVDDNEEAGSSNTYLDRQAKALTWFPSKDRRCSVCYEYVQQSDAAKLDCKHVYCLNCLKDLFMRAAQDEGLFPPKCCRQHIPRNMIEHKMSAEELVIFSCAELEFSTLNRTYCSNTSCGKFVPPTQITIHRAQCAICDTETCTMCKNTYHVDDCAADPELQATLILAEKEGWKRCSNCKALVELNTGCYHITCKCGAERCYICTRYWKLCICEAWDERNLGLRAEEVVDREALAPLPAHERRRRVIEMEAELRERHECEHSRRFERIVGGGRHGQACELCGDRHWKYILRCRHCHLQVCEDCRRHRV